MEERLTAVPCTFCNRPVRLAECELNDLGEPAHDTCLAERRKRKEEIKKRKGWRWAGFWSLPIGATRIGKRNTNSD